MNVEECAQRYLLLGLRVGRLRAGLVDAYLGPEGPRRRVAAEPVRTPAELAAEAAELRRALPRPNLGERRAEDRARRDFLDKQLVALECGLRGLAGEPIGFRERLRRYFDTEVLPGDRDRYRAAHAELAELLPGSGPLGARMMAHRERERVPAGLIGPAVQVLSSALRARTSAVVTLPGDEEVRYVIATDRPWSGFNEHLGGHRSQVTVNTELVYRAGQLAQLVAHEAYPGHHAERCRARAVGAPERAVQLLNTPASLLSEGFADAALLAAVGPDWGSWLESVLAGLGLRLDGELIQRVERVLEALRPVRQDAALMLHERGADESEVRDYLCRWLLITPPRAGQLVRFLAHPVWRSYTTCYVAGYSLAQRWLAASAPDEPLLARHRRALDEPWTPSALRAALDRALPSQAGERRRDYELRVNSL
jgi:hypothetical protein